MGQLFQDLSLRNRRFVFKDRIEAGRLLARKLPPSLSPDALLLAIPAGGVPVALELARQLHLPMDLMIVRKVQIPGNTEAGFGAVGPDGEAIFNEELLRRLRLPQEEIIAQVEKTRKVVESRNQRFRGGKSFPDLRSKTVILVDDGLASGFTVKEAVRFVRRREAKEIIIAVPTAPEDTVNQLLPLVDEIYCLNVRSHYPFAVAEAYRNWYDLPDEEVLSLLKEAWKEKKFSK
jgi:predicted phosphoribosyltransferase